MNFGFSEEQEQLREFVRQFLENYSAETTVRELMETESGYDAATWSMMAEQLGLQSLIIPEEYGGMGLDYTTFASIFEELSKGFMSISGAIGSHHILTYVLTHSWTDELMRQYLPVLAIGKKRGGLALS